MLIACREQQRRRGSGRGNPSLAPATADLPEKRDQHHHHRENRYFFPHREQEGPVVKLAGRVTAARTMGKASFLDLTDATGRIQLFTVDGIDSESFFDKGGDVRQRIGRHEAYFAYVREEALPVFAAECAYTHRELYAARRDDYSQDLQRKLAPGFELTAVEYRALWDEVGAWKTLLYKPEQINTRANNSFIGLGL